MSSSEQPQDISAHLNRLDTRLDELREEVDLVRTMQNGIRREVRSNSQALSSVASLERTVSQLADIAHDHQEALRLTSRRFEISSRQFENMARQIELAAERTERVAERAERDRQIFQAEIRRIWEYLLNQSGNGNASQL
jgi:methyl-accepting chemotaxis protein